MSITAPSNTENDHDNDAAVGWSESRWIVSGDRARFQTHTLEA